MTTMAADSLVFAKGSEFSAFKDIYIYKIRKLFQMFT